MTLIDILIAAIIIAVVVYVAKLIIEMLALPAPIKSIAYLIIGLVVLVLVLQWFGVEAGNLKIGDRQ